MAEQMINIESQLAQMQALSIQHYKGDEAKRLEYLNGLYEQRLREYAAMFVKLEVR